MTRYIVEKIRPGRGFAHFFHLSFIATIPLIMFVLIRINLSGMALLVLLLSKWRMVAVHPRHWITHFRTNAVDIIVGLSFWIFLLKANRIGAVGLMILFTVLFEVWLLYIKPGSSTLAVSIQAILSQALGLVSLFLVFEDSPLAVYVVASWLISYFSARHFLAVFEEKHGSLISSVWAFFAASFVWILGHWLLFFGPLAEPAILLASLAFGLSGLYYLDQHDRLSTAIRRQILVMMFTIVFAIIVFSEWGDKTI